MCMQCAWACAAKVQLRRLVTAPAGDYQEESGYHSARRRASPGLAARGTRRTCQHGLSPVLGSLYECWPCRTAHRCTSSMAATTPCSSAASSASAAASSARSRWTLSDAPSAAAAPEPIATHSTGKSGGAACGSACSRHRVGGEGKSEGDGGSWGGAWAEAEGGSGGGCVGAWRWGGACG